MFVSKSKQAQAYVFADYTSRLLVIKITGRDAKDYLDILRDEMIGVFGDLKLEYREWVTLPKSARCKQNTFGAEQIKDKAPYQQLLACARQKQPYYIAESGYKYDLNLILGSILPDAARKNLEQAVNISNHYHDKTQVFQSEEQRMINQSIINSTIYGSVAAAQTIANSLNHLQTTPGNSEVKSLLAELLNEIKELNAKVPAEQEQVMETLAENAEILVNQSEKIHPNREWYELSLKGIKEAATSLKDIGVSVLEVAAKLSEVLL